MAPPRYTLTNLWFIQLHFDLSQKIKFQGKSAENLCLPPHLSPWEHKAPTKGSAGSQIIFLWVPFQQYSLVHANCTVSHMLYRRHSAKAPWHRAFVKMEVVVVGGRWSLPSFLASFLLSQPIEELLLSWAKALKALITPTSSPFLDVFLHLQPNHFYLFS